MIWSLCLCIGRDAAAQQDDPAPSTDEGVTFELKPNGGDGVAPASAEDYAEPASSGEEYRDPFWPVGYKPEPPRPATPDGPATPGVTPVVTAVIEDPPAWDEALKTLSVKGVMKGKTGGYMAAINNQVVSEGDVISSLFKARKYTWKIKSIGDKGVSFERLAVGSP